MEKKTSKPSGYADYRQVHNRKRGMIMLSKKEYKENLIRMFDSLRDEHKGEENCIGVACGDCPLYKKACGSLFAFEAIEFAEKWTKEHQIKTNADKFEEVFGFEPLTTICSCVNPDVPCEVCEHFTNDRLCDIDGFWEKEYKPREEGGRIVADKDEQNLELKQENVIDNIAVEIEDVTVLYVANKKYVSKSDVLDIINKYKNEREQSMFTRNVNIRK